MGQQRAVEKASAGTPADVQDIRSALLGSPPSLPSRFFYDDVGSALFERITELPEYYPTRTEQAILAARAGEIVAEVGPAEVAEIGAGSSRKTRLLLDAARPTLRRITLLDVNASMLAASRATLRAAYPGVNVTTVTGDFLLDLGRMGHRSPRLLLFLGSTIGNLRPAEASVFLRRAGLLLGPRDAFLVGFDLVKDAAVLEAAYDDSAGVTSAFNRNILAVVNRAADGDFEPSDFDHVAFFDRRRSWIEMRLRARRACRVTLAAAGLQLDFARGSWVRTEISCKYTRASVTRLLRGTGLRLSRWDTDEDGLFALALLRPRG